MKKMMGFSVLAALGVILVLFLMVGLDWQPTPAACEPHGLRQMPC
jgi:hypothetical protein